MHVKQFNVVVILVQSRFKEFYLGDGHNVFKKSKRNFKPNYKYWNVLQDLKVTCIHKVQGACEAIQCCNDSSLIKIQKILLKMYLMCFKSLRKNVIECRCSHHWWRMFPPQKK